MEESQNIAGGHKEPITINATKDDKSGGDVINRFAYNHFVNGSIFETLGEYYLASQQYHEALKYIPESAEIRLSYALSLFYLRDFEKALIEARNVDPQNLRSKILIADCFRVMEKGHDALAAYNDAILEDSLNIQIWYHIARYYEQFKQYDSAAYAFSKVTEINPTGKNYQKLGNIQIRAGLIEKATNNYLTSIELDSSNANMRSYLGLSVIYEEAGDLEKAIKYQEEAAKRAPDDKVIQNRLLGFYEQFNMFDKAIPVAREMIKKSPQDRVLMQRLGVMYYLQDSLRLADSVFTYILETGVNDLSLQYYVGRVAFLRGDLPRAEEYFQKITIAADSVLDGWMNLGMVYYEMDSVSEAIATYETGLGKMTNINDSLAITFSLAAALERNNEFDRSVALFESILVHRPEHGPSLNYLGYMLAEKGIRLDYAKQLIEKALQISPENGAYIDSYGWLMFRLGKYKQALEHLTRAYETVDDDPIVLQHLGDTYQALDDLDNARLYWKKALELDPDNDEIKERLEQ